jgi:hypothetical protein
MLDKKVQIFERYINPKYSLRPKTSDVLGLS